jgi:hypothetical protein
MTTQEVSKNNPDVGQLIYANRPHSGKTSIHIQPVRRPSWSREIERAMRATDLATLVDLVHAAEKALFLRCQELGDCPNTIDEREAIRAATNNLLAIKIHRLKWPDFRLQAESQPVTQGQAVT